MIESESKNQFLLLFRGYRGDTGLSPQQMQENLDRFFGWVDDMKARGILLGANPLGTTGKVVSAIGVSDGPFAESKEAVGGYFLLRVDTMDEAVAVAQACPALERGAMLEVRPVAEVCPTVEMVEQQLLAQKA